MNRRRASGNVRDRRRQGFTLIELALVLVILATFVSLVLPRLDLIESGRLESSSRRLAALLGYLHDEAALRGRVYRMRLDLDRGHYRVEEQLPPSALETQEPEFDDSWDMYARPTTLPAGVRIERVELDHDAYTSGTADLYFLPEDASSGITITLSSESGGRRTLSFDGTTGAVSVTAAEPAL